MSSIVLFFDLGSDLTMKRGHDGIKDACFSPMFVMPKHRGIGRQVLRQVHPIAAILELIENAVDNLSFTPFGWTSPFLLG